MPNDRTPPTERPGEPYQPVQPGGKALACVNGVCVMRDRSNPNVSEAQFQACVGKKHGEACGGEEGGGGGGGKTLACVGGTCQEVEASTPENIAACRGKNVGDPCESGTYEPRPEPGTETEGCPQGNYFASKDGTCPSGYVFIKRTGKGWEGYQEGSPGRCECIAWCEKKGYGSDCRGGGQTTTGGDEFGFPPEITGGYQSLLDRFNEILNRPRGYTEAERQAIINYATEGIVGQERGALQDVRNRLASMGVLGETFYTPEEERIKRQTRQLTSQVQQGVAIDELTRRFNELMTGTGVASDLLKFLTTFPITEETLNAARRAEGNQSLNYLLALLGQLGGQSTRFYSPYLQALLSQQGTGGGGAGFSDWLPWLSYLAFPSNYNYGRR